MNYVLNNLFAKLRKLKKNRVFSNFISLSALQGVNLILPLLTFPYLVRVLGVEIFGLVFFAQAFISYFSLLAEYGFNFSGTREISLIKNDYSNLSTTFNSILLARFSLVILGFFILSLLVFTIPKFKADWALYFLTFGTVVGNSLFPVWFFQGMEKMKFITILTLISKIIFTLSIFLFVNQKEDYLLIPLINTIGAVIAGVTSLILIRKHFGIRIKIVKIQNVRHQLVNGWYIFLSTISTNIYTATTTFILGLVTNNTMVGYYSIANKCIRLIIALFTPFIKAVYPHVVQLQYKSKDYALNYIRKILKYFIGVGISLSLLAFLFAEQLFLILFDASTEQSITLFKILTPLIFIIPIAGILFNVVLLSFRMDKYFLKIYATGAVLNIILLFIFLYIFNLAAIGATISLLICETVITIFAFIIIFREGLNIDPFFSKRPVLTKTVFNKQ